MLLFLDEQHLTTEILWSLVVTMRFVSNHRSAGWTDNLSLARKTGQRQVTPFKSVLYLIVV